MTLTNIIPTNKRQQQPGRSGLATILQVGGALAGGVAGGVAGGPLGALQGASLGGSAGGLVGGLVSSTPDAQKAQVGQLPQLNMSSNTQQLFASAQALQSQPQDIQQQYGSPIISALIKSAHQDTLGRA